MAIRTILDLGEILRRGRNGRALNNLSTDLGGAIFYRCCAVNILPGAAIIGVAIFTIYSISSCDNQDAYFTSSVIGKPINWIGDHVVVLIAFKIIAPVTLAVIEIVLRIFSAIAEVIGNILKAIPLPESPIWIGVGCLGAAVLVVKVVLPALGLG